MMSAVSLRRLLSFTLALTVAAGLSSITLPAVSAPTTTSPLAGERDFSLTAHRGAPTRGFGENTLATFREALDQGATAIETDLRRTKDDQLVVLHDSGVGRTTNCAGPIGAWTLRKLTKKCRENHTKKPLPTAAELLDFADKTGATLMIELKGSNWSIAQVRGVVNLIKDSNVFDQVSVSSLRVTVLRRVRRLAPNLDTQLIVSGWPKVASTLGDVTGYNVPAASLTKARVKRLHRRKIVVVGGQANSPAQWRRLAKLGVDGVVTPSVRRYTSWERR